MNSRPMILRLDSGSETPSNAARKRSAASTTLSLMPVAGDVILFHLFGFTRTKEPVVNEHTGQLVADSPMHQSRRHRGIHSSGQSAQHVPVTDLAADRLDVFVDDVAYGPGRLQPGDVVQEVPQDRLTVGCGATSGWNWTPAIRRSRFSNAATGAPAVRAVAVKPSGTVDTQSV